MFDFLINTIKDTIKILFFTGIMIYYFLFGSTSSLDEKVFNEVRKSGFVFQNKDSKKDYNEWLSKQIEKETK